MVQGQRSLFSWLSFSLLTWSPVCLCVFVPSHPNNFLIPEPVVMKLGMYIMATESISVAYSYFLNSSHQSVSLYVYPFYRCKVKGIPSFGDRRQPSKRIPTAVGTHSNRRIVGHVILCVVCFLSKESLWVYLCISLSLIGNSLVKMFPWQWRIVGSVIFYAVLVILHN
jgi:hypothetical protein